MSSSSRSTKSGLESPHLTQSLLDGLFGGGRIRFFSNQGLAALANTCGDMHAELASTLTQRKLVQHVVHGEQNEAEVMIKANPRLLLIQTHAIDYSGRRIIGTPFQAALGAEDERMWAMMQPYFTQLESSIDGFSAQEEMNKQFNEQFPGDIIDVPVLELQSFYNQLATAIVDNDDAALESLRNKITERKEVKSGKHFNSQYLIAAYQAYTDNFNLLATWDNRDKFWKKVIGYVQRQMSANYAQAYCSGIKSVIDDSNQFKRTLDLSDGSKFFPLAASVGPGFDCGVYSYHRAHAYAQSDAVMCGVSLSRLSNYVEQKQNHLSVLERVLLRVPIGTRFYRG